jgi:hypothetical protein
MRDEVRRWNWRDDMRGTSTESAWEKLRDKVTAVVEKYVPKRRLRNRNRPPWLTQDILREVRRRKRMWARDKNNPNKDEYREQDRKTRNMIRTAKRKFERKLADGGGDNKRPFYAYVKTRTRTRQSVGPLKDDQGNTVSDLRKMADLLNNTFGKTFTRENTSSVPDPEERHEGEELSAVHVTVKEVKEKIKRLRRAAAAGPDGIGPGILLELKDELAPVLAKIFNKSLSTGEVPKDWKDANVTPIFKKARERHRKIIGQCPCTSICCKLLESVVKDKIMTHLKRNGLIRNSQHGFLPGRNCTTNLLSFFEKVTREIDSGGSFDAVFLDF